MRPCSSLASLAALPHSLPLLSLKYVSKSFQGPLSYHLSVYLPKLMALIITSILTTPNPYI